MRIAVLSPLLAGAYYGQVLKGIARQTATLGGRVVAIQTRDGRLDGTYPWLPGQAGWASRLGTGRRFYYRPRRRRRERTSRRSTL